MPGDVLEVGILDINLALNWGYNRQRAYTGALPEESGRRHHTLHGGARARSAVLGRGCARRAGPWRGRPNRNRDRVAGKFQFIVRKDMKLTWQRAETPTHWIVMGLHSDLDEGMKIAVRETIDLITKRFPHLTREEAYMIASVAVDYHVTQVVDGTKGIHGMIPRRFSPRSDREEAPRLLGCALFLLLQSHVRCTTALPPEA